MRRRKLTPTVQVNTRLSAELVNRLEKTAREERATLSEKIRELLEGGLAPKPELSLDEFRVGWLRRVRDTIEHEARKDPEAVKNIEADWRNLQALDVAFAHFYGDMEIKLQSYVKYPKIRELLRGAPTALESE
jgi:hypothetical protein